MSPEKGLAKTAIEIRILGEPIEGPACRQNSTTSSAVTGVALAPPDWKSLPA